MLEHKIHTTRREYSGNAFCIEHKRDMQNKFRHFVLYTARGCPVLEGSCACIGIIEKMVGAKSSALYGEVYVLKSFCLNFRVPTIRVSTIIIRMYPI